MMNLDEKINELLNKNLYELPQGQRDLQTLEIYKELVIRSQKLNPFYKNLVKHWPIELKHIQNIYELPFLPVTVFKSSEKLTLVDESKVLRTVSSSATSGQTPSTIPLDRETAKRMSLSVSRIYQHFIGSKRRPLLVVDVAQSKSDHGISARSAAIRSLLPYASKVHYALIPKDCDEFEIDHEVIEEFQNKYGEEDVLIYGFTTIVWKHFFQAIKKSRFKISLPHAILLHSGGWKKLEKEKVKKSEFNQQIAEILGNRPTNILDFYGMAENVGVIYPDCEFGNKHVPLFADVIIRDPITFRPAEPGHPGIIQVCSILPTSFPGHLLLTQDMGLAVGYDNCQCSRKGISFRLQGRVPKSEIRGCGNILASIEVT